MTLLLRVDCFSAYYHELAPPIDLEKNGWLTVHFSFIENRVSTPS